MRIETRIAIEAMNSIFENLTKLCLSVGVVENRDHTKNCDNDDYAVFDEPRSFGIHLTISLAIMQKIHPIANPIVIPKMKSVING